MATREKLRAVEDGMKPRLNTVSIKVDNAALEAEGYSLWRFSHPQSSKIQTFSVVPGVWDTYKAGSLSACVSHMERGVRQAYFLVRGDDIPFRMLGPKRVRFDSVDPGLVLRLALLSGDVHYYPGRETVRGLHGTKPVWDKVECHLKVVIEWLVTLEMPGVYSLYPECRGLRTHRDQWGYAKARKQGTLPIAGDGERQVFMFRLPAVPKGKKATVDALSKAYEEVPGAQLKDWRTGDLLIGASVKDSKESSLCWASSSPSRDARSRSTALVAALRALPRSPFKHGIKLTALHTSQDDARVTTASKGVIKEGWLGLRVSMPKVALVDLRLRPHHSPDQMMSNLGHAMKWMGRPVTPLRSLDMSFPGMNMQPANQKEMEAAVAAQVLAWHEADDLATAWLCLVDDTEWHRDIKEGKYLDTKKVAYRVAVGRPLQSTSNGAAFMENPMSKRLGREARQAAKSLGQPLLGKRSRRADDPGWGPLDAGSHIRMCLAQLGLDAEILGKRLMRPRPWLPQALGYVFLDTFDATVDDAFVWLSVLADGSLSLGGPGFLHEAVDEAGRLNRRLMFHQDVIAETGTDGVHLHITSMRAMPPNTGTKTGWTNMSGLCTYPDLMGYTAAAFDTPASGSHEKGVAVRVLRNAVLSDLAHVAAMCMDPLVRIGQATVLPAPFQLLREWHVMSVT